ncbi:MAG: hypothetical protein LBK68_05930 [Candidatus Margulisbacteria bacterium]|jgi:hypothetical protein|nr:hypothetical protein [Candidatus Margulisiibacteriota bacterium]
MYKKQISDKSNVRRAGISAEQTLCEMVVWSFTNEYLPFRKGADIPDYEKNLVIRWGYVQNFYKSPDNPLRERINNIKRLFKINLTSPEQTLCEMVVWSFTNEYLPRGRGANVPDYEKDLARRWNGVQNVHKSPDNPLRERINKIKGLFKSKLTNPEQTLCEMVVWSFTNEYLPLRKGADIPDYEKNLAIRWGSLQNGHKSPDDPLRERINKIKGLFKSKLTSPEQTLCEIIVWSFTNEYLPLQSGTNVPDYEKHLADRWNNILKRYKSSDNPLRERIDSINSLFKRKRNNGNRHLDIRSATMDQLEPLAQEPREIIYHKDFLKQGTAILESYFRTDQTNGFNPDGFNTPDNTPKHRKNYFDQSFTPEENQQAVEYVLYEDIQDLLRSIQSKTNFTLPKPNQRRTPPVREIHNENTALHSIADALDIVQEYAGWITDADYKLLQNAYLEAAAEPANMEKCRELVNVLKELQIQYLEDKFAAFCLVLEDNYKAIDAMFGEMIKNPETTFEQYVTISGVLSMLSLFLSDPAPEKIRALRIDFNNHSAQTKKYWRKIMEQVELLVHN